MAKQTLGKLLNELQPFLTCESRGHPDPAERDASVVMKFHGPEALDKAQALHDAIVREVLASR